MKKKKIRVGRNTDSFNSHRNNWDWDEDDIWSEYYDDIPVTPTKVKKDYLGNPIKEKSYEWSNGRRVEIGSTDYKSRTYNQDYNRNNYDSGYGYEYKNRYEYTERTSSYHSPNGYGNGYYKSTYNNGFTWGNFGSIKEDNDELLIIKGSDGYLTPTYESIKTTMQDRLYIKSLTGSNKEEIIYNRNEHQYNDIIKNLSRYFYHDMFGEEDVYNEKYKDRDSLTDDELNNLLFYDKFIDKLKNQYIPGISPVDKAINCVIDLLSNDETEEHKSPQENINDSLKGSGFGSENEVYECAEYEKLLNTTNYTKKFKNEILNKISLIRKLGEKFKVETEIDEKEVENSKRTVQKKMRDLSQLRMVQTYQQLLPGFDAKLATKNLSITMPIETNKVIQKIIMIIDKSGSMNSHQKQIWVLALLLDRMKYIMRGEAELFVSYFLDHGSGLRFKHLTDEKSCIDFMKNNYIPEPYGGDTNIGRCINYINESIQYKKLCNLDVDLTKEKVEILLINDGQDSVKTDNFSYKTNAISLIDYNHSELKQLCLKNKGKYVFIDRKDKLHEYE